MSARRMTEEQIERESVEQVFGLTGGELSDESWGGYAYNYEGVPEYAGKSEFPDTFDREYRTVIVTGGGFLSAPDKTLEVDGATWELQRTFTSSGETTCPWEDGSGVKVTRESAVLYDPNPYERDPYERRRRKARCQLCEERIGSKHGYVHVGEGYEAVYRLQLRSQQDTPDMRTAVLDAFAVSDAATFLGSVGWEPVFEHGHWWINAKNGAQWSVVDASGGGSIDGFDFEQVSEGEEDAS